MKIITTTVVGVLLAAMPFAVPVVFAQTTGTAAVTATSVSQSVSSIQATLQAQIAQLLQQIKALQVQITQIKTVQKTIAKSFAALRTQMRVGSRGKGVRVLQKLLASDPSIYPQGLVTGYYGRLTEAAVKKFQENHGISPVGQVGPETRMLLNSFLKRATSTIPMNFLREVESERGSATSTNRMVMICHRAGNSGMMVSERIARRALFFHVRRGDSVGECEGERNDNRGGRGDMRERMDKGITTSAGNFGRGSVSGDDYRSGLGEPSEDSNITTFGFSNGSFGNTTSSTSGKQDQGDNGHKEGDN